MFHLGFVSAVRDRRGVALPMALLSLPGPPRSSPWRRSNSTMASENIE